MALSSKDKKTIFAKNSQVNPNQDKKEKDVEQIRH